MPESDDDKTRPIVLIRRGSAFAHYQILERIGAGGMGEVQLAHDTKLDRRVALKLLPESLADDPDVRTRFLREARAAARLDHPNIITIYEVGEFEGRPYIAMQYVAGKPLSDFCGNDALTIPQVLRIASGICEGLAKAHAAGITHRDIKPANILLDADLRPVLLDFGLANLQGDERLTRAGSAVGTVAYMSPEQARGLTVGSRSDLFSCGIVLYELIAGRSPFRREGEAATLNAVATATPEPLARYKNDVPDELQRIVTKCLAKSPDERYQTAADLLADLRVIERSLAPGASSSTRTAATQPSVAVLPFTNMSADPENEFFSDGLSEELLNVLAKNPGLKVTGRTSSFLFKGKKEDLREIGQKLGVGTLLEGSVRRAGNRVRIAAQLVNAGDGFHLWSETYDRVLDDVFALQDEIARAVAEALNVKLLGKAKAARPVDPESYALVLRANHAAQLASKSSLEVAVGLYRNAIELDPKSGRPWAGLARCLLEQSAFGLADHAQGYRDAKEAIRRAMELDDELPETYEALSWILAAFDFRFQEAGDAIEKAYSLAPNNPRILATYALTQIVLGRFEEGLSVARRAVELDPLDPGAHQQLARIFFWAGRHAEAEATLRRGLELSPGMASGNGLLSLTLLLQGRLEEALEFVTREGAGGYRSCGEAMILHTMGRKADSDRALADLIAQGDQWAFQVACVYAWRGEIDSAFETLEKAYRLRDTGTPMTKVHPLLQNLHGDPRWPVLLKKIGLSG